MLVSKRMTKNPVTVDADEFLSVARDKMTGGGFHRLPVTSKGKLVGIITDRDLRAFAGVLERTKVNGIIGNRLLTVTPSTTVEEAAQQLLTHKIGGLPVVEADRLVGMITTSDILKAFLEVMGAAQRTSTRIDFVLEGLDHGFVEASKIVSQQGGEILGVGTYREKLGENPVCYMRVLGRDLQAMATALRAAGFDVLGVHEPVE